MLTIRGFQAAIGLAALASALHAQQSTRTPSDIQSALAGSWVGTLEYRDYSEPATSTKRVKLPAWLSVEIAGDAMRFTYTYDDGPGKVVTESSFVRIDSAASTYRVSDASGKTDELYTISGLEQMRQGRGTLILTGKGTENHTEVEVRTTLRIGRNIVEVLRDTAPPGKTLSFRDAYTFVRATAPNHTQP